jgi:hypothetical protein
MADLVITKPTPGQDANVWGDILNTALDSITAAVNTAQHTGDGAVATNTTQMSKAANLSDVTSATTSRTNLGLDPILAAKADLVAGKVPSSQLPPLPPSGTTWFVASQAEMLALSAAIVGDHAVRTDLGSEFVLAALPSSSLANWLALAGSGVISVNGHTGVVLLTAADVSADASGAAAAATASALQKAANLSDLANAATARTNLGLGTSATQPDTAYLKVANNLSDLSNVSLARSNMGLGTAATASTTAFDAAGSAAAAQTAAAADATSKVATETTNRTAADALKMDKAANLSDVASAATARTNLGLGGAAVLNVGTTAGTVCAGDDSRLTGGGGGATDATLLPYDSSTSAGFEEENALVDGQPVLHAIAATDVAGALDYLNRFVMQACAQWYLLGQRDALRRMYPLVGSNSSGASGEWVPGIKPQGYLASNSGAALTLSQWSQYPTQDVTLTSATVTLTLPTATVGADLTLLLRQDGVGGRVLTWAAGTGQTLKWPGGTQVVPATTASRLDIFRFICAIAGTWLATNPGVDVK